MIPRVLSIADRRDWSRLKAPARFFLADRVLQG
jgi:hypothetical protein